MADVYCLEIGACARIRKNQSAQRCPVERAVRREHPGTESFGDPGQQRLPRCDHLACELVRVNHWNAEGLEQARDCGLAARDAAREANTKGARPSRMPGVGER